MAFYKLCDCGWKNTFAHRGMSPRTCTNCGRILLDISAVDEGDAPLNSVEEAPTPACFDTDNQYPFTLRATDGSGQIPLPAEGGIIGRAHIGAELLESHLDVSRAHVNFACRGKLGIQVNDCSKYGTFYNGEQLTPGENQFIKVGDSIHLHLFEVRLERGH